jgi:dolichol-phosphate mannosyltransferase
LKDLYEVNFIFVIDIRTSDSSKKYASQFSEVIIDQMETTGKGAAVKQAVDHWKKEKTSKIIFLDADGSYSFSSVLRILEKLAEGHDVVSGSRFILGQDRPEGMSRLHSFGNRALSKISSIRNGRRISDLCTGLWGFSEEALSKFDFNSHGFDLEAEIAGLVRKNSLTHIETNVNWEQRKGGTSKLRSLTDGFIIFLRIIRT